MVNLLKYLRNNLVCSTSIFNFEETFKISSLLLLLIAFLKNKKTQKKKRIIKT